MVHLRARAAFAAGAVVCATSFTGCADVDASTEPELAAKIVAAEAPSNGRQCGNPNAERDTFQGSHVPNLHPFPNHAGLHATYSTQGGAVLDTNNPFFQSLGTNGRTCATCHTPEDGFSISAANVQKRFQTSCGLDPIFRPVDGANNPNADVSTFEARQAAYTPMLHNIRSRKRSVASVCAKG